MTWKFLGLLKVQGLKSFYLEFFSRRVLLVHSRNFNTNCRKLCALVSYEYKQHQKLSILHVLFVAENIRVSREFSKAEAEETSINFYQKKQ